MVHRSPAQFRQAAGCWCWIFMYTLQSCAVCAPRCTLSIIPFIVCNYLGVGLFTVWNSGKQKDGCEWVVNNMLCAPDLLLLLLHSFAETSKQERCILITTCKRIKLYLPCRLRDAFHVLTKEQGTSDCCDSFMSYFMRFFFTACEAHT